MYLSKKKVILVISISVLAFFFTYTDIKSQDVKITDGDTIKINGDKIRFSGIDTPELKQTCTKKGIKNSCGLIAKQILIDKIVDNKVECIKEGQDQYKRILAEWTDAGGEKTFVHTIPQFFQGFGVGILLSGIIPMIIAGVIGYGILGLRGHYFAICTLALGIAAGEIAGGIEIIGAGQGMTVPVWPKGFGSNELSSQFLYYLSFALAVVTFITLKWAYSTRFGLVLNAIRDNEDKAEAMGIHTMRYKIIGWMVSAFFVGIAGGLMGHINGYIEPTEIAFAGPTFGVFMVLMAILGGKGTLWGPLVGATVFHLFKEGFWTYFLGWQYVALGVLIVVIVVYFPEGIMGWLREKYPEKFGETIDEADRKAQVELK
ncbi:thermonuclease family protein [Candidatus Pelagibacter sp.]|nr:thermonuclease family protein [Candidatus Pelagibacter sp.]